MKITRYIRYVKILTAVLRMRMHARVCYKSGERLFPYVVLSWPKRKTSAVGFLQKSIYKIVMLVVLYRILHIK